MSISINELSIVALTQASGFAKHCPWPQIELTSASMANPAIIEADVLLLCPERLDDETRGALARIVSFCVNIGKPCLFATYKGYEHFGNLGAFRMGVQFITHCRSNMQPRVDELTRGRVHFVPLALDGQNSELNKPPQLPGTFVFVGGRKDRDFGMAYDAVQRLFKMVDNRNLQAVFVSDKLPSCIKPSNRIMAINHRVDLPRYREILEAATATLVPVVPGNHAHGHSDCVRSIQAGTPIVVTRGASCDDYVDEGITGVLVDHDPESMALGMQYAIEGIRCAAMWSAESFAYRVYMQRIQWLAWRMANTTRR